ncbi:hypothetical protein HLV37_05325 [Eggerthellaceae bacterium zg-1084]|uniref:Uncharacterized protein n=1 Tax=Berryella wangjianweii TaxID=2734634 RepID=A0A6M8J8Y9_9ACTN|nr:hypothetical protein [Berryella wangjianweii]NPD31283.1 hypothetical protein [Berryella wangjianweii]NPD32408.1 hypothetical protein [Eggerthellaceae bacterium zg-997]QKF07958.1 hypothetical protein HLV38_00855 [Berryella wangjianweii]
MPLKLNLAQERELHRLIDYERSLCEANDDPVFRCAFPYRPDNDLQSELIEARGLLVKNDPRHGTIVVISSAGYSHFPEKARDRRLEEERARRDARLIALTALYSGACMAIGVLLGLIGASGLFGR